MKKQIEQLWKVYDTTNEWIRFSDTKATAILAMNGIIAGFYFSNMTKLQNMLAIRHILIIPLVVGVCTILFSTICSALCMVPRLKIVKDDSLIFFSDIAKGYSTVDSYEKAIKKTLTDDGVKTEITHQIWANSKVAHEKYNWITYSVYFFAATVFASLAFVVLTFI